MKRTLSITHDSEAGTLMFTGENLFSLTELFGIAAQVELKTRLAVIENYRLAAAELEAKQAPTKKAGAKSRKK